MIDDYITEFTVKGEDVIGEYKIFDHFKITGTNSLSDNNKKLMHTLIKYIVITNELYVVRDYILMFIESNGLQIIGKPITDQAYVVIKKKFNKIPNGAFKINKSFYLVEKDSYQKYFTEVPKNRIKIEYDFKDLEEL